jgi:hypothetical protein
MKTKVVSCVNTIARLNKYDKSCLAALLSYSENQCHVEEILFTAYKLGYRDGLHDRKKEGG